MPLQCAGVAAAVAVAAAPCMRWSPSSQEAWWPVAAPAPPTPCRSQAPCPARLPPTGADQATLRLKQLPAGTPLERGTGYGRIAFSCPAADLAPLQVCGVVAWEGPCPILHGPHLLPPPRFARSGPSRLASLLTRGCCSACLWPFDAAGGGSVPGPPCAHAAGLTRHPWQGRRAGACGRAGNQPALPRSAARCPASCARACLLVDACSCLSAGVLPPVPTVDLCAALPLGWRRLSSWRIQTATRCVPAWQLPGVPSPLCSKAHSCNAVQCSPLPAHLPALAYNHACPACPPRHPARSALWAMRHSASSACRTTMRPRCCSAPSA